MSPPPSTSLTTLQAGLRSFKAGPKTLRPPLFRSWTTCERSPTVTDPAQTKTEQTVDDPEQSGVASARNYSRSGWVHNRLHPYDRTEVVTDAILQAQVVAHARDLEFDQADGEGRLLRDDQALADAMVREESFVDHEYRHRLMAPHINAAVCGEIADHLEHYNESTKAAVMRQRAKDSELHSKRQHPEAIDPLQVAQHRAMESAGMRRALCPNAMARAEQELRYAEMMHSNALLYGHPRGRFI
eukprot:TRINITY_DN16287_c0_g1_i1.p2 TRINITY_DN16287_c0_g1~~TRINITY_DN16287_c0_g1_i1.p2  ORF type:complete len:243 (+),score=50.73 TRINITY_DN16287_c0_g1_i1:339-1067(+)